MRVRDFKVCRTKRGVIVYVEVELEAEIRIDIPMHVEFTSGLSSIDIQKLNGELPFEAVSIKTELLRQKSQAEKAAKEIKALLNDLNYRETIELNRLLEVEQYLKKEFQEYIPTPNKEDQED